MPARTSRRQQSARAQTIGSTPETAGREGPVVAPTRTRGIVPSLVLGLLISGVVALAAGLGGLAFTLHQRASELIGPQLQDAPAAPDFALRDQNGEWVQLSALRGKVVALTFLYVNCADVCPLIASKLGQAQHQLGADQSRAVLLAVTVDPERDTPAAVRQFSSQHQLQGSNWHYLLGSLADLQPVWKSYYVGTDAAEVPGAPASKVSTPGPKVVGHTAIVYLIDPRQRIRVALDADFAVGDFLHDVRALLRS